MSNAASHGVMVSPVAALAPVLHELHSCMPQWVERRNNALTESGAQKLTEEQYQNILQNAILEAKELESEVSAAAIIKVAKVQTSDPTKWKWKKAPPQGRTAEEHARLMRDQQPQKSRRQVRLLRSPWTSRSPMQLPHRTQAAMVATQSHPGLVVLLPETWRKAASEPIGAAE